MPDMNQHQHTGYLAQSYNADDLATGIVWVLDNPERHAALCKRSRQKVEQEFILHLQAKK